MSLNLQIGILNERGVMINNIDLPQINTENTLHIIGNDNNIQNQVERLIHYFEENKHLNEYVKKAKELRNLNNLEFYFL